MKREFLEGLKLEADVIDKIMAENGKDVNREKAKYADYDDIKAQLEAANKTIEKFKDYDQTKADVEKYKAEAEKAQKEAAEKIAHLELTARIKDFTGAMTFVNDFTRDSVNAKLEAAMNKPESRGKSLEDLFKEITEGKENIVVDDKKPTPPVTPQMAGNKGDESGVLAAFKRMNPDIKID
ncbi:MAG: phage scaffolding protein [Treponema sp.]|nr:phage scaffolding protein [Treponema sp.]MBR7080838.1 phage scaffolding protein [Treponema sp.]